MAAPVYPLTMPTDPGYKSFKWFDKRATGYGESLRTGRSSIQPRDYAISSASLALPPMNRQQAAQWTSFLLRLEGMHGSFYLPAPDNHNTLSNDATARGNHPVGTYTINGTFIAGTTGNIEVGQRISVGSGANEKMYQIVDVDSQRGTNQQFSVSISPKLKQPLANGADIKFQQPRGVFRLNTNTTSWNINEINLYGITLSIREDF